MTTAAKHAERERMKRVTLDHMDRITRAINDAGPAGITIGAIRTRTMIHRPHELLRVLGREQQVFSRPDDGGLKGALRWFASRQWRDEWKPPPKVLVEGLGWGYGQKPKFAGPCRERLIESKAPEQKPPPVHQGALDFKSCPSIGM